MKCPNCQVDLAMADRDGVEIDYCPKCRGVWLDRGELDKIIDRVAARSGEGFAPEQGNEHSYDHEYKYRSGKDHDRFRYRKRKSFLGEIFDFD